jgi:anoctamin-7
MVELTIQLSIIMVGKQAISNIIEVLVPLIKTHLRKKKGGAEFAPGTPQYRRDYVLVPFGGLFAEYLEMVLQFGFMTLFVAAFPLAPMFAFLNNVLEIRIDATKFIYDFRRAVGERAEDIGTWEKILQTLSKIAVITNAFVIGFTSDTLVRYLYRNEYGSLDNFISNQYAYWPPQQCYYVGYRDTNGNFTTFHWHVVAVRLAFIVAFEHIVFFVSFLIDFFVPDVPGRIRHAIEREEYLGRMALEQHARSA